MIDLEKNRLGSITAVDKRIIIDHAFDCNYHDYVRRNLAAQCAEKLVEKAEFTEKTDPGSTVIELRMDVYVFSPSEVKAIQRELDWPGPALDTERFLSDSRLRELNAANARVKRLEKELAHIQSLSVDLAMFQPPPIIMVDGDSYNAGYVKGEAKGAERIASLKDTINKLMK